jgi:4a-hydroxytetrahydrobiopterin dehydratase
LPRKLTGSEIDRRLKTLAGWRRRGRYITKTFEFGTFMEGIRFLNRVAEVAEEQEHHPDVNIVYTTIKLSIQTHSEGGLTSWDFDLAEAIEKSTSK